MRNTQRKGDIGVTQSIATFTRLGYDVALPITESAAYDLLVDDGSKIHRVQVRYTSNVNGEVDLRRIHSNSSGYVVKKLTEKKYDWLYILRSNGAEYLIKECRVGGRSVRTKEEFRINK